MRYRIGLALCTAMACSSLPLAAQTVQGEVHELTTGKPVPGGFVVLQGADGSEIARALTDPLGRFTLRATRPGRYRLKTVAVGRVSWESEPFDLEADEDRTFDVTMSMLPVALPALIVEADRRCRVRPGVGVAAGEFWNEARKALEAIVWTERNGTLRHRIVRYERELEPRSLDVRRHRESTREGVYRGSSFVTAAPQLLAERGYVRETLDAEWIYEAPDARVLLSEAFADLHCLAVERPHRQRPGFVGLTFEPVRGRDVTDISGVMWLDAETAELRQLEFRYSGLPWEIDATNIGGLVQFRRLPEGPWMVEKWWIRMPQLGYRERQILPNGLRGGEWIVIGILEQGGWVDEVQTLAGSTIWNAPTARLEGVVMDESSGTTVGAATVHLLGTDRSVTTDGRGTFAVDSLAPGRYRLAVGHPAIDVARHVQPPFVATLGRGDTLRVEVRLRAVESIIGALCPGMSADSGVIAGLVRVRETGASVSGAAVAARWSRWYRAGGVLREERLSAESETDESGYYYLCGMPLDATLTVQVSGSRTASVSDSVLVGADRVRRHDFELPDGVRPPS
jgi:hypothetical protein